MSETDQGGVSRFEEMCAQLPASPTAAEMRAVIDRYRAAMSAGDLDGVIALFAPDARWEEPVGTTPVLGADAIRAVYAGVFERTGGGIRMEPDGVTRVAGNHAVAASLAYMTNAGQGIVIDTANVIECDTDGRIVAMKVYVGPTSFRPA